MGIKVAVALNSDMMTVSLNKQSIVKIFQYERGQWNVIKELMYSFDETKGIGALRQGIIKLCENLDDCNVIVGKEIIGLPYQVLDMKGMHIWEFEGQPEEYLDYIRLKEHELTLENGDDKKDDNDFIKATDADGCFEINLKEMQKNQVTLSSKQVILPFIKNNKFYQLKVVCSHVPPWFKDELLKLDMKMETTEISESEYIVNIVNKICSEK